MSDLPAEKPQTQGVGVVGFVAFETKPEAPQRQIDWARLVGLPSFQMFASERRGAISPSERLYAEYCDWHSAKGYWPDECPMGYLINAGGDNGFDR